MSKNDCATCVFERTSGVTVDTSRSKSAWAKHIGISEASVRRHFKHSQVAFVKPQDIKDDFLEQWDIPIEAVTSRGMSIRQEDGSWQKATWQPNKKALLDTLKYSDLAEALDGWEPDEGAWPTGEASPTAILNAADLQIGKAQEMLGGTPETIARVRQSVERFAGYVRDNYIDAVVLVDNGDPIENVFNAAAQVHTNDLDVPAQIRVFRRLMLEAIKTLAPLVGHFYYVAVPSNHGAFRTGYKAPGGTSDADFGLEISHQLEDAVRENPHLTHVEFVRPEPLSEIAVLEVSNTKLAFHHGHQSAGPAGHEKWWQGIAHGRMPGWDADIMVLAHYHSLRVQHSGNGRWIIGVSSSDNGSSWFTDRTGGRAQQGMTAFDVQDGNWSNMRIL